MLGRLASRLTGLILLGVAHGGIAADSPFEGGWTLDPDASSLTFQSIKMKDGPKAETSRFATVAGGVDERGVATLRVALESVDTEVDLRNVRMRFLFFETFRHPEAVVTAKLDPAMMSELEAERRLTRPTEFELDLHGVEQSLTVQTRYTMFSDDQVSVATVEPVVIEVEAFGLMEGIRKLEDAAGVSIVPSARVGFDLVFQRGVGTGRVAEGPADASDAPSQVMAVPTPAVDEPVAVETVGSFSAAECAGRFEILSQAGAIYFRSGSAQLDGESAPLLGTVAQIMDRCPDRRIVIGGHTDSVGDEALNMRLSFARAESIKEYLAGTGVDGARMRATGFGESQPIVPNDTRRNRQRNRRIEFALE